MKKYSLILIGIFALFFTSCEFLDGLDDYKDPDVQYTATYPLNGEWYIHLDLLTGADPNSDAVADWELDTYGLGYNKILLYNTASNRADSLWLDDLGFWPTKSKILCNPTNRTFPNIVNAPNKAKAAATVTVVRGGVYLKGATTAAGNVTDSINIVLTWADDPGTYYRYTGYRRTGFLEDEH